MAPDGFLIGRSVHSEADAVTAAREGGCDYLVFGSVFESRSKPAGHAIAGLETLARVCAAVRLPVVAIGGITTARVPEVVRAGAAGIAAIGLFGRAEPGELVEIVGQVRQAFGATPRATRHNRSGTLATHYRMDPGYRSPLVDLFLRGEAARDVRLLAARGLLPRPAQEQVALLIVLVDDPDPEIAAHARATMNRLPREALADFLTGDAPAELRAFLDARGAEPADAPRSDASGARSSPQKTAPPRRETRAMQRPNRRRKRKIPGWCRRCRSPSV